MSKIFGGSKQKSKSSSTSYSSNRAFPMVAENMGATSSNLYNTNANAFNDELAGGFEGYQKNTGFDFMSRLGLDRVGSSYAGRGTFGSGAAMKALSEYQGGVSAQSYNTYLDKLAQAAALGSQGQAIIAGAGGESRSSSTGTSSGSSSQGAGGFLGALGSTIAMCDRRLKENIVQVGYLSGTELGLYEFNYEGDTETLVGPMADEVEKLYPEALGPVVNGYQTVNLTALKRMIA